MKKLTLKESHAPYKVSLDENLLSNETVIFEKDGQPVAALVPIAEYIAFQTWREAQERRHELHAEESAFADEQAAFERMLSDLLQQYPGRVVAVYGGQVVDIGDDKIEVWERTSQKFRDAPVYIQRVEYPAKVYKMPHRKYLQVN